MLYIEGLAPHGGPESCVVAREGAAKRWQGCVQARLWSREINEFGVPTLSKRRKATSLAALLRESSGGPARSENQGMYVSLHVREPGGPMLACHADHAAGRSGNAEAVSLG